MMKTVCLHPRRSIVFVAALLASLWGAVAAEAAGYALQFDGTNDHVTMGQASGLGASTFTLECWFKRLGTGTTTSSGTGGVTGVPLICKGRGEADGSNKDCNYFFVIRSSDNVLAADFEDTATGGNHPVGGTSAIQNNVWYHAAATYDGTTWRLYLNGQPEAQLAVGSFTPRFDSIQHFSLATAMTSTGAAAGFLNGIMDEVRVWNYARTQQQIQDAMYTEITTATGLLGRWGLNEGTGTTAGDSSGNSINGTVANGAVWVSGYAFPALSVTTAAATSVSGTGATLNGQLTDLGGAAQAQVYFRWGTSAGNLDQTTTAQTLSSVGTFSAPISGLTEGTTCYFKAVAEAGSNTTEGSTISFLATSNAGLAFDGVDDYVGMGTASGLGTQAFTIETWFKRTGTGVAASSGSGGISGIPLVCKGAAEADGSNVDANYFFAIRSSDGVIAADFEDTATGLNHPVAGVTPIQNNTWYHAAATYDGTTWSLYLNGQLESQLVVGSFTPRFDSIQHFSLATSSTSTGARSGYFAGVLDEARVWNYARTLQDIRSTINQQVTSAAGLLGRWGLNESSGSVAGDSAGNNINGAISGAAWVVGAPFDWVGPLSVASDPATGISGTQATLNGQLSDLSGAAEAQVFFRWGSSAGNLDQTTSPQTLTAPGAFSATISGLTEGTTYYSKAVAEAGSSTAEGSTVAFLAASNPGLTFDGVDDYVGMGTAPSLGAQTFTIETWLKRTGTGVSISSGAGGFDGIPLVCKGAGESDGSNVDANYFLAIRSSDDVIAADFEDMASGLNHPVSGVTPIQQNVWYHAAATYDGVNWRLYLNGVLETQLAVNAVPRYDSIQHFSLGTSTKSTGARGGFFAGVLDEIRVWNYARTQEEIRSTINQEVTSATGLLGRWGLNEGVGTTAGDSAGSSVNGTISGVLWTVGAPFNWIAPLSVQTLSASVVSQTEATLNGQLTDLGTESQANVFFRWGTSAGNLDQTTTPQALTAPGTFSKTLTGLTPETTYYYQAVAQGTSQNAEGAVLSFVWTDNFGIDFNGTSSYVTMGSAAGLGSATFTIETWFKRTGTGQTADSGTGGIIGVPLVCKGAAEAEGTSVDGNYFFAIRSSDNVIAADFEDNVTGLNHPVVGVTPIQNNTWYHAAATYDGTTWRLYLNGQLETELLVGSFTPRADSIQHFSLATSSNSTGARSGYFDGVLDEVRVWNFARTQEEIRSTINQELTSATGLLGRWGMNEGVDTTANDSTGNGNNGTITNGTWALGAPFDINYSPEAPTLVRPANAASIAAANVHLTAHVTDPEEDTMVVKFFGRLVDGPAPTTFRIVVLPDTQNYSSTYPQTFNAQTQWIIDNRESLNIAYVAHVGDIVDSATQAAQWQNADGAMSILDTVASLPYGLSMGNHDQNPTDDPNGTAEFNTYFPYTRYQGRSWYGGHYGTDNDNHFVLFSAAGMDFIAIHIERDPSANPDVLAWAAGLLQTHSTRRGIVVVHNMINTGDPGSWTTQGQATYNALRGYPNLFLMLCGHDPGEGRRTDVYNGNTVYTLLADYQNRSNGGNGWLRILEFDPVADEIRVKSYSPTLDQYETDADSQFTLPYAMTGVPFTEIGTVNGVAHDSDASVTWTNLDPGQTYEWYATSFDGKSTTQSQVWSFSTTAAAAPDFDSDGDVDAADVGIFQLCATGPAIPYVAPGQLPPGCTLVADVNGKVAADFDGDEDLDLDDFGVLQRCFSGDHVPVPAGCTD